jgi:hypothetical protein
MSDHLGNILYVRSCKHLEVRSKQVISTLLGMNFRTCWEEAGLGSLEGGEGVSEGFWMEGWELVLLARPPGPIECVYQGGSCGNCATTVANDGT